MRFSLLLALCALACAREDYAHLYRPQPLAPGYTAADVSSLQHLGATRMPTGVNFAVYSEHATKVQLLLFDDPESNHPTRTLELTRYGDAWNVFVEGVGLGTAYGYVAWGPNWPYLASWKPGAIDGFLADVDAAGNRFNPNKLLFDPYARAFHRDHDWSKGSTASGPNRTQLDYAAAAKSVVVESAYQWSANEAAFRAMRKSATPPAGHRWQDLVVYEVHPKGFTADAASGVQHPGSFRGVGENAGYFQDLGINAVELMPVFEKPLDGGYWGYQTIGFFAPELTYAADRRPGRPIDEFKWMVDQLHQRGVEVILDVVYNHTGEGGLWRDKIQQDVSADPISNLGNFDPKEIAGLYSFRGLDNAGYYALQADRGQYVNDTGVGDMTRCDHTPMKQLILDSLHYWAEEMHVDGFRFDLAPILGEKDLQYGTFDPARMPQTIIDDPVLQALHTRIIAEPWSGVGSFLSQFPASKTQGEIGWYEWNGGFRDWWREFVNNDAVKLSATEYGRNGGFFMTGSYEFFHDTRRHPYHSVNFVTVHDGFTLYDLFSYDHQLNGCGPLNPVCCDSPSSAFCDPLSGTSAGDNRSRNWGDEAMKRQQMRNLFTAMIIAPGTPMLLGGDEWMRTQLGNNNAYTTGADNPFNWFDWGAWKANPDRVRMHDFVRRLLKFRGDHSNVFADADYPATPYPLLLDEAGAPVTRGFFDTQKHLAQDYNDAARGRRLYILINMEGGAVNFKLPAGVTWQRLLDTQAYFEGGTDGLSGNWGAPAAIPGSAYGAVGHSIVILQAAQ